MPEDKKQSTAAEVLRSRSLDYDAVLAALKSDPDGPPEGSEPFVARAVVDLNRIACALERMAPKIAG